MRAVEHKARSLYALARQYREPVGDFVTRNTLEELITDEEGHIDILETQLDLVAKPGEERYALLDASKMDENN